MERSLSTVVVAPDVQSRCSDHLNYPPAQRGNVGRFFLARLIQTLLSSLGHRLKRLTDKLDRALHAGVILRRGDQCQIRQLGQPVQIGAQGIGVVCHDPLYSGQQLLVPEPDNLIVSIPRG
jgi:hypothetical protein